jgi:glutamate N-acetyltransferase / amino-acid N-acetyltransferase
LGRGIYQEQGTSVEATVFSRVRVDPFVGNPKMPYFLCLTLWHDWCRQFPGAPIIVGKSRVAAGKPLHAIVVNNKVSNVCSGGDGVADSEKVCAAVADALKLPGGGSSVLPSSTGVIGWRLPATELANLVPDAVANIQTTSGLNAAQAIMTTDRFPKVRSQTLSNGARIVGIAKGAGMIEPNMATMLSYIMTDATVPRDQLQAILSQVVNGSYNSISVDGDESTSDTVALISSNKVDKVDIDEFKQALTAVCQGLASDIVRNGEGTGHVIRVNVVNFPGTDHEARRLGRHVVNSPLFKCAVSGNDPNTGRLAAAIGSFMGKFKNDEAIDQMSLTLGGRCIFQDGKFVLGGDEVEKELSAHMADAQYDEHSDYPPHQRCVEIGVDFGKANGGSGTAIVLGSDLTNEYVAVNADYRS